MALETYELVISGTLAGQFVQNVFHLNVNNAGDQHPYTKAKEVLATINLALGFVQKWADLAPASYTVTSMRCKRVLAAGGPTAILLGSELIDAVGNRTGAVSSVQLSPVLVWITDPRPEKPGRCFIPGISETDIDAMVYTAGWLTAANALITKVTTPFVLNPSSDPTSFGVLRRNLPGISDSIDFGRISPVVGTQRRRLHPV